MSEKNIQELIDLAKRLEKDMTKEEAFRSLVAAGILDQSGNYTEPYKELAILEA